jgi:RNA polymerase-binding transcription factor
MTPVDREAMARRLQALRETLLDKGAARIEPNRTDGATTGVADEDAQALNEMYQVLASSRNQGQAETLARIDRALARLASDPDLFGLCEECEEAIPLARLEAMPDATLCTECQAKRDPARNARRRSTTDFSR